MLTDEFAHQMTAKLYLATPHQLDDVEQHDHLDAQFEYECDEQYEIRVVP
ncbi:hypothetical protein VDA_002960 [Photobacterium damselae subsp. damselae CIP 102761]|uniref:Uncharacterized protein n=1 Tax=Photobacterium damselae subsp. damselae CIP 102761 TaxID=675817 RepID=D0Z097_PHODD|nr:hypothetical protein VDA_002960 [Photobacterium damselae subsp. damselae CIP 102761]